MHSPPSMFETPRPTGVAPLPPSDYLQPNLGHGLRIWWAFWWPTTVVSTILTLVANTALRRIYERTDVAGALIGPIIKYDAYLFGYVVAIFGMAYILRKNFRHFHIALLSNHGGEGAQVLPPTPWRTVRVWWTYSWRTLLYMAVAWVVVILPLTWFVGVFNPRRAYVLLFFGAVGFIIGAAVGLYAIYSNILDEDIGDFRVALSRRTEPTAGLAAPATPANPPGN